MKRADRRGTASTMGILARHWRYESSIDRREVAGAGGGDCKRDGTGCRAVCWSPRR